MVVSFRNAFALSVSSNGPSTLSYAWMWYQFPYGVIAVALSTAMLTEMSESAAKKDWDAFKENVRSGLSGTMFLIFPLACLMFSVSEPLIALYHAGQFTAADVENVAHILNCWCISLPFYAGYMYLYRAFSAMQDLGLVTAIDVVGRACQSALYGFLTGMIGLEGIPAADAIFYFVAFFVLCIIMRVKIGSFGFLQMLWTSARSFIASAIAGGVAMMLVSWTWKSIGIAVSFLTVVWVGIVGLVVFYVLARLLRVPETKLFVEIGKKLKRKLLKR